MNSVVIYGSRYGNTRKLAEAIAGVLQEDGEAHVFEADATPSSFLEKADLIVVGGPTEGHGMTGPIEQLFDRIGKGALAGKAAAAFDTRLRWPLWLSGTAASGIASNLRRAGAVLVMPQMSFLVAGKQPELEPGELLRAEKWARALAAKVDSKEPAAAR
jgi:flavodoxin